MLLFFKWKTFGSQLAHLKPLSFHQALKASDGSTGWIQDDLCQGSHLQCGVRPFCAMNKNWRPLPKTTQTQFFTAASFLHYFMCLEDWWAHFLPDLSIHWAARQAVVRISLTWLCQFEASSLLNQRSMLCDWSLHASTSLIRLSWRTLDLERDQWLQFFGKLFSEQCVELKQQTATASTLWGQKFKAISLSGYTPLNCFMDPPPLGVVSLRLKASTSSFGLLGHTDGARVDDVTTLAWPQSGIDQFLIFLASPTVGTCQRLPCSHHHLKTKALIKIMKK